MNETEAGKMRRREFLVSSSFLLLGTASLEASALASQTVPRGSDLSQELTPAELQIADNSIMARDMDNFWHKGYS